MGLDAAITLRAVVKRYAVLLPARVNAPHDDSTGHGNTHLGLSGFELYGGQRQREGGYGKMSEGLCVFGWEARNGRVRGRVRM